ncbi:MAG: hypothetical protein IJK06_11835 [Clostridia bacterium]|nr:hypothetical protein [Clostridia bacterium]
MAVKALNFKMEESEILAMKEVAEVFHISMTDIVRNGVREYIAELKKDPFYRLTANVRDASEEESAEVLSAIADLSDDDLSISSAKTFTL